MTYTLKEIAFYDLFEVMKKIPSFSYPNRIAKPKSSPNRRFIM